MNGDTLAAAVVASLDDPALDALADRLVPRLASRLEARRENGDVTDRWMTTREAAGYLGTTPNALHKLTAAREIPFTQEAPGCRCYFRRSDLDAWRESGCRGPR